MKKIIIYLLLFSFNSYSFISEESKNIIREGKYRFSDSWVGTVWSSCWARKYGSLNLPVEKLIIPIETEAFENGEYLANVMINRGDSGASGSPRPVSFIVNGIFGEPVSGLVKQVAQQLIERGHHVVGLGNPLGTWALKQKPTYTIANFVKEAEVYLDIMEKTAQWLNQRGLSSGEVNLVGVSYGGFLSGMIKSMDSKRSGLISGMTTLLSPPLKMGPALRNMDHVLFQTSSLGKMPDWVLALVSLRFCALPPRLFVDPVQQKWAKAIFGYYGFQRSLADNTMLIDELYGLQKVPTEKKARKRWRRQFTFSEYIENYAQELGELMDSPYGELYYWLDQVDEREVQIFASLDDPLNDEIQWPNRSHAFLIEYGGHYGLRAFKFFDEFLFSIF